MVTCKLSPDYYEEEDVVFLARDLLGKGLFTRINGVVTGGLITETEAYRAPEDKASHAYGGRRTARTEVMFRRGGCAYVYLCYGMHHLFNVVTGPRDVPHAILIRALAPLEGIEVMRERRRGAHKLAAGPGTLSQALGITTAFSGAPLDSDTLWIADVGEVPASVTTSPRIGIDYAEEWKEKPWRFCGSLA